MNDHLRNQAEVSTAEKPNQRLRTVYQVLGSLAECAFRCRRPKFRLEEILALEHEKDEQ